MRLFYDTYADNEKLAPMVREIGWSHNLLIMEKCKDALEREFYLHRLLPVVLPQVARGDSAR